MMKTTCPRCGRMLAIERAEEKFHGVCPKCLLRSVLPDEGASSPLAAPLPGTEFGNYVILGVIGSGGMGIVYKARQKGLERTVALKILPAGPNAPAELISRFLREARAAAKLNHPNIVPIHEVSSLDGTYFYSMDFVEGRTLSAFLKDRGIGSRDALEIVWKVARAVQAAHESGVIHRDLKPDNIMVDPAGEPKILDFGIAKTLSTQSAPTATGGTLGTPPYMSPEQAAGAKDLDARADVYALGAILYEVLTGRPPHTGETAVEVLRKLASENPAPPSRLNPDVPRAIETLCLKAIEKDRAHRYGSAEEFAQDVRRYLDGEPILARPMAWPRRAVCQVRRRPALLLGIPVGAVLLLAAGFMMYYFYFMVQVTNFLKQDDRALQHTLDRARRTMESLRFGTTPPQRRERVTQARKMIEELTREIQGRSGQPDLYYWRGRFREEIGEDAMEDYSECLKRDPRHSEARYRRALVGYSKLTKYRQWDSSDPAILAGLTEDAELLAAQGTSPEHASFLKALDRYSQRMASVLKQSHPSDEEWQTLDRRLAEDLDEVLRRNPSVAF
ncbi:MAG: serine/threonine protein kinase [Planctomycetes bacterium]|nr:serine/threonine protein kinase [Planctomycetota bacterium]